MQFPNFTDIKNYLWPIGKEKKEAIPSNNGQADVNEIASRVITESNQNIANNTVSTNKIEETQVKKEIILNYVKKNDENEMSLADLPPELIHKILAHIPRNLPYDKAIERVCRFFKEQIPNAQKLYPIAGGADDNDKVNRNIDTLTALLPRIIFKPDMMKKYDRYHAPHTHNIQSFESFEDAKNFIEKMGYGRCEYVILTGDEQEDESNDDIVIPKAGRFYTDIVLFFDQNDRLVWAEPKSDLETKEMPTEKKYFTRNCTVDVEFRNTNEMAVKEIYIPPGAFPGGIEQKMNSKTSSSQLNQEPIKFEGFF